MKKISNVSIRAKLVFILSLTSIIALFIMSSVLFYTNIDNAKEDEIANIKQLAEISSINIAASISFNDEETANKMLAALNINSHIMAALIYDQNNELFAQYFHEEISLSKQSKLVINSSSLVLNYDVILLNNEFVFSWEKFDILVPINNDDEIVGILHIIANTDGFREKLENLGASLALAISVSLVIIFLIAYPFQKMFSNPIYELLSIMKKVPANRNYNLAQEMQRNDEYGMLFDGFNTMMQEFKHIEKELIIEKDKANQANQIKSDFLANMSHEIRTPMNAILGLSELALNFTFDKKLHSYLSKINNSATDLLGIINDILDFSKIEAGMLEIENNSFHLFNDVIDTVIKLSENSVAEKNITLCCIIDPEIPQFLMGDALRLKQVLINLISNAIKFTEQGYINVNIQINKFTDKNIELIFEVQDSGIGINPEQLNKLFKPFTQADTSTTRKFGGTGLGLAICKQLTNLMGGDISVTSDFGIGSTFTFTVLLGVQSKQTNIEIKPKKINSSKSNSINILKDKLILLVEDNIVNQMIATEFLKLVGIKVNIANNGKEAVEMAFNSAINYDAILMDIQMPEMDGIEATKIIRDRIKDIPIIAMTAYAMDEEKQKFIDAGMNIHIPKPINSKLLYKTLEDWVK